MSDDIKLDQEDSKEPFEGKPVESRRQFTKAGLAGSAVLMSLVSRPALANSNECTASILASGNLSSHPDQVDCKHLGCSPGFWKHHTNGPGGNAWKNVADNSNITFGSNFTDTHAFGPLTGTDAYSMYLRTHSLIQVINSTDFPSKEQLGFDNSDTDQINFLKNVGLHAVAALANSYHSVISTVGTYPLTATVRSDFVLVAYSNYIACLSGGGTIKSCMGPLKDFADQYDEYGEYAPDRTCPLGAND